ncbi:DUF5825 family protein [Streptomyces sp. CBMA152]|uniref:DUF5825 family protein n=1 Tax=Streptomyces sp. CBMA152 TaxID=1896312 RepID=UPI001660830E|nr:DUF5825 family protein [Streptomyces sp. CBMA152]MBD0741703.1 hypothetical protein [Streptomyces sp. CBMA152]
MTTALTTGPALTVTAWRDYDPEACGLPGMDLGERELTGPVDAESDGLWELGARRVRLARPVDLAGAGNPDTAEHAVRALSLVRDLTARAVLVEWELLLDPAAPDDAWRALGHLQPPQRLEGPGEAAEVLESWRRGHYLCKCLWRQGPGFVQIRDRRWGDLRRFTADEPEYREAIADLSYGAPAADVPAAVLADFLGEQLVLQVGELAWWLPYRVSRWLQEGMVL